MGLDRWKASSFSEFLSLAFERGVFVWWVEQALVFVVVGRAFQETLSAPDRHGLAADLKVFGDLGGSEFAGVAQSLVAALQVVVAAEAGHDAIAEGLLVARGQRLVIEDAGDFAGGVFVEQGIDLLKNRRIRFASFAGVKRSGQVECSGGSARSEAR